MSQHQDHAPSHGKSSAEEEALYFNTVTLSRFMRANYGAEATTATRDRIAAYTQSGEAEIAEIWSRVLAHLTGVELKEDHRRRLKVNRPLSLR